ncbi:dihydrofolate reductase family protein [Rhizobacter sp. Root29]|uniref:dihydrofolate reductase family protein n=1 Tax=unclassified Rhizobacter TaxID=2640088 RepID=UPI003519D459
MTGSGAAVRKVVLIMTMSIDGYVVAPEGMSTGGLPESAELKRWKLDRIRRAGTHIMGRVSYEEMGPFWQRSDDAYAAPMNDIPKVVFSKTLKEATWPESSIARGDLHEDISELKKQAGGEIIAWGGAAFAQALSKAGLIDEYVILTRPIAYGGGKPLFSGLADALKLKVLVTAAYDNGTLLRIYAPR